MAKTTDKQNDLEGIKTPGQDPAPTAGTGEGGEGGSGSGGEGGGIGGFFSSLLSLPDEGKKAIEELKQTSQELADAAKELKADSEVKVDSTFVENSTKLLGTLNFDDLIGNPLRAAIKAQRDMSKETLAYIKETGILSGSDGESKVAVVAMNYMKDGKKCKMLIPLLSLVPIPSLGITEMKFDFKVSIDAQQSVVQNYGGGIPLAAALVAGAETSSDGAGKSAAGKDGAGKDGAGKDGAGKDGAGKEGAGKEGAGKPAQSASVSISPTVANIAANYSSKKDSSATKGSRYAVETTMDINITAKQYELPTGLKVMLDNLAGSVEEIDTNGKLSLTSTVVTLSNNQGLVTASYRNGDGVYEPSKIEVSKLADGGDTVTLVSGDEVHIIFSKAGTYVVKAEKLQTVVFVS